MSNTVRSRQVFATEVAFGQADFFQSDGFTRVTGIVPDQLAVKLFFNNEAQPWQIVDGGSVPDVRVTSGRIYWHEVSNSPGFYSVRFRPSAVGYWRLVIAYTVGQAIVSHDYDVTQAVQIEQGLKPSFVKPGSV